MKRDQVRLTVNYSGNHSIFIRLVACMDDKVVFERRVQLPDGSVSQARAAAFETAHRLGYEVVQ